MNENETLNGIPIRTRARPDPEAPAPHWIVWSATLGLVLVVGMIGVGALVLALGVADPPVAGPVVWQDDALPWANGPVLTLVPDTGAWFISPAALPGDPFTLAVRGRLDEASDPSAAWGVWLEVAGGDRVLYAISGEQYTTTRCCPADAWPDVEIETCPALHPDWRWMPYNRLHGPGMANTITLHRDRPGQVRLRLNDETLGIAPVDVTGLWGVWVRGGRAGAAVLTWEEARLYG